MTPAGSRPTALVAAGGEAWEPALLRALAGAGVLVLRRCVDVRDLLAAAATGESEVAVVAGELPGLDADAVGQLRRRGVGTVLVRPEGRGPGRGPADPERWQRLGAVAVVEASATDRTVAAVLEAAAQTDPGEESADGSGAAPAGEQVPAVPDEVTDPAQHEPPAPVVAVWGATGAPGRTTLAVNLAAEHAAAGGRALLVDADVYGGSVAQHLGILDEVSGLLAAARRVNEGTLDADGFAGCVRRLGPGLDVLTGLPRPDRWIEIRAGVMEAVLEAAGPGRAVVVDCGFGVDEGWTGSATRDQVTLEVLGLADVVVVVGSAEPSGLARLVRALVDLREVAPGVAPVVVVNRMRETLGWSAREVRAMVEGYAPGVATYFVRSDQATLDRAQVAGTSLVEQGESDVRRDIAAVLAAVLPAPAEVG